MRAEGVVFRTGVNVGVDVPATSCAREFDAIVLAGGADGAARSAGARAASCKGIHFAMEYLTAAEPPLRRRRRSRRPSSSPPKDKHVDHHRRRRHRRRLPRHRPPPGRARASTSSSCCRGRPTTARPSNPWPLWPNIFRVSSAHEEGRRAALLDLDANASAATRRARHGAARRAGRDGAARTAGLTFVPIAGVRVRAEGRPRAAGDGLRRPGAQRHARRARRQDDRARQRRGATSSWMTSVPGVFTAGDMQRGQSLIVWAIAEGRSCRARRGRVSDGSLGTAVTWL